MQQATTYFNSYQGGILRKTECHLYLLSMMILGCTFPPPYCRVMNYSTVNTVGRKSTPPLPLPPWSLILGTCGLWPTSEPLSAILGTTILWDQGSTVVPNTANRGSDVGQKSSKINDDWGGGGCLVPYIVHYSMIATYCKR